MIRAISSKNGLSWKSGRPEVGSGTLGFRRIQVSPPRHQDTKEHEEFKVRCPLTWCGLVSSCLRGRSFPGSSKNCSKGLNQPLVFPLLLNSEGVILTCFLNTALKADFELKPTSSAMAMTV